MDIIPEKSVNLIIMDGFRKIIANARASLHYEFDLLPELRSTSVNQLPVLINQILIRTHSRITDDQERDMFLSLLEIFEKQYPQHSHLINKFLLLS